MNIPHLILYAAGCAAIACVITWLLDEHRQRRRRAARLAEEHIRARAEALRAARPGLPPDQAEAEAEIALILEAVAAARRRAS